MRTAAARRTGVAAIASVCLLLSFYLLVCAVLLLVKPGVLSLGSAAWLLGGMELRGPVLFLLLGALFLVVAFGLWTRRNWAGLVTRGICIGVIALSAPAISSAVVEYHTLPLLREGSKIILSAAAIWYLSQEHVLE
jgi:hypothetical protein